MSVVTDRERGMFPKPGEIKLDCSCADWASMCKHVAAVLYGVGSRLDDRPESLFVLRDVDSAELIATEMTLPDDAATDNVLADDALAGIFGIDLDTDSDTGIGGAPPSAPKAPQKPARRRAVPATERQAPPIVKAQGLSVSTASGGRLRKAASGTGTRQESTSNRRTPRQPSHRQMGGPAAPAERSHRRRVRRTAWCIASDRVPLGSEPRAAQPAISPVERPDGLVPAVRKVRRPWMKQDGSIRETNTGDFKAMLKFIRV